MHKPFSETNNIVNRFDEPIDKEMCSLKAAQIYVGGPFKSTYAGSPLIKPKINISGIICTLIHA